MKILQIVAGVPPGGGISESVPALCRHLRQLGHDVTLATLDGPVSDAARAAEAAGVRLVRFAPSFPRPLFFSWQMVSGLPALVREAEVVHVHSNWTFPVWWGCCCALRAGTPLVMSPRGCLDPVRLRHSAGKKRLVGWLDRFCLRRAAVIHATAECEKEWVLAYLARREAAAQRAVEVAVIPNGIEVGDVLKCGNSKVLKCESALVGTREYGGGSSTNERMNFRINELPLASSFILHPSSFLADAARTRTVLYVGRLHALKGLDMLVSAWKRIADNYPDWRLLVVGPDEQGTLKKLKEQVDQLGLEKSVSFQEALYGEEKARLLAAADLFVLPTRSENFGIAVAEALASGVPVITTKGAPWQELLGSSASSKVLKCESSKVGGSATANGANQANEDNSRTLELSNFRTSRCGWWVDIGVEPLAEALREALSLTDEQRHAMGANGRRLVESKYRWNAVAARMAGVYREIIAATQWPQ